MVFLVPTDHAQPTATIAHEGSPRYSLALSVADPPVEADTPLALSPFITIEGEIHAIPTVAGEGS